MIPTQLAVGTDGPLQPGLAATDAGSSEAPPLVHKLRDVLEAYQISYCQWKGHSLPTDRWVRGEGDLDLLVARSDAGRLATALGEISFKQVVPVPLRQIPGTESYFGLDPDARRFVHIHVHYHLRLGHYRTMNYHLPFEAAVLASSMPTAALRVPAPELEFIVFVVRMVLSHSVIGALRHGSELASPKRALEWHYFASRVTHTRVCDSLNEHLPGLSETLFHRCVRSLSPGCPIVARLRVRRQLGRLLRTRRRALADTLVRLRRGVTERVRGALGRAPRRNRLVTGGLVIAVLGGDGAGKTTAVRELHSWLSSGFDASTVHLGKPRRSIPTLSVSVTRRLIGLVGIEVQPLLLLWSLCVARDRYRSYARACRRAAAGAIVICDRYPTTFIRKMDGPSILTSPAAAKSPAWLVRLLARSERSYYTRILPPDLSIVLRVDPDTAAARKIDEDSTYVRTRSREVWDLDLASAPVQVVDANRPAADVLSDLRSIVWSRL